VTLFSRRSAAAALATLGAAALVLTGCAAAPESSSSDGSAKSGFLPCMVSDSGGFDDKSFNQLGYEGLVDAAKKLGVKPQTRESNSDSDYAPNIQSLIKAKCTLIITVGFNLSAATVTAAKANPKIDFAIIDDAADNDFDGKTDAPNIKPILFDTAQAAFLAGYAAASYTKTGTLGTFAGQPFPTVTIFMDGFDQGMKYYNEQKGKSVKLVGYDPANPDATLQTGAFTADDKAKQVAQTLIDQNADVILPVGGPIFQSAGAAIEESGKDIALLGCDADVYATFPKYDKLYFTSILKGMKQATDDVVTASSKGSFDVTPYVGTLKNDGVGIADFHDFKSKVDGSLDGELKDIKAKIISGDIKVTSYLNK
jgi:basic membrane protein A and related proteins